MATSTKEYRPSDDEPFMNERQREFFRQKLLAWTDEILEESRGTIASLKQDTVIPTKGIFSALGGASDKILKEMDFREALKNHDWSKYQDCYLTIHCSTDAIIPTWAYMLVASYASGIARDLYFGDPDAFLITYFREQIRALPMESYMGAKVVIKGCSDLQIPASAYLELTHKLKPHAASIMFGEPCSTVPVYKKPKS